MDRRMVLGAVLLVAFASCGYQTAGRATRPGIYVCRSPEAGAPVYRLDTEHAETLFFVGGGGGIEFRDLNTGATVRLKRGERGYTCETEVLE